jgi:CRISPR-associated protein Cas2
MLQTYQASDGCGRIRTIQNLVVRAGNKPQGTTNRQQQTNKERTMYYIAVYDVTAPARGAKLLKMLRTYLHHVQNSVCEGELTPAQYEEVKHRATKILDEDEDSFIIYCVGVEKWMKREIIGIEKRKTDNFL